MSGAGAGATPRGEDDVDAARPSGFVKAGGVGLAFAGFVALLVPAQMLSTLTPLSMWGRPEFERPAWMLAAIALSGLGGLFVGVSFMRARGWAATTSIAVALGIAGSSTTLILWADRFGMFLAMPYLSAGASALALVLCAIGAPSVVRVAMARERLRAAGLDLGR